MPRIAPSYVTGPRTAGGGTVHRDPTEPTAHGRKVGVPIAAFASKRRRNHALFYSQDP
ncbi:hypothetical protein MES5069_1390002 [Mesorhizobium escarrei]|uniref:Uncharacterized protein n=1 Tax=Mesorhizobium escarrei TaxID=666018 RepID=A0ABN8JEJ2_9HYPH|nr:hypothetical protein MES5069_1390002 [Mesorhizobium escarrei]